MFIRLVEADPKQLNNFQLNPQSLRLIEWTSEIDLGCDEFYHDFQPWDPVEFAFACDEKNFRTFPDNIILQIKKYWEE